MLYNSARRGPESFSFEWCSFSDSYPASAFGTRHYLSTSFPKTRGTAFSFKGSLRSFSSFHQFIFHKATEKNFNKLEFSHAFHLPHLDGQHLPQQQLRSPALETTTSSIVVPFSLLSRMSFQQPLGRKSLGRRMSSTQPFCGIRSLRSFW